MPVHTDTSHGGSKTATDCVSYSSFVEPSLTARMYGMDSGLFSACLNRNAEYRGGDLSYGQENHAHCGLILTSELALDVFKLIVRTGLHETQVVGIIAG